MFHYIPQSRELPIVVKATLLVRKKRSERCSSVTVIRRAIGLEVINTDLRWRVQVPPGFSPKGF